MEVYVQTMWIQKRGTYSRIKNKSETKKIKREKEYL